MQELLDAARNYSDIRLLNTINQAHNYSKQQVEAAKTIALERGLLSEDGMANLSEELELVKEARRMLEQKSSSVEDILAVFSQRGIPNDKAEKAVHEASKIADLNRSTSAMEKEKESSAQWWWWLFIAFFVIRMILRSLRN